ncbi:MAG: hypothetical protein QOJ32_150 [Frankiaceae bacterium]|nr:hypothetical protein [Frankiaceae bacterium]
MTESRRRWFARGAIASVGAAALVLICFAGLRSLTMLVVGCLAVAVMLAAGYGFLAHHGARRWVAAVVGGVALLAVPVVYVAAHLLWVAALALGLLFVGLAAGAAALTPSGTATETGTLPTLPTRPAPAVRRPFLVMNPWSGGGKVVSFDLVRAAEALGAEVHLLGAGHEDVQALAEDAVRRGADLLGVAGGDGTQALVAAVASEHDLPFLVIPAGTRNHFALDLGLDRVDPRGSLSGLTDNLEARIDLGSVGGRTFVNNASFGAYAEIVQDPAYRDDKRGTALRLSPQLMTEQRGIREVEVDGRKLPRPQAILVSNGAYATNDLAGPGRRTSLVGGKLGLLAISVSSAWDAVGLLGRFRRQFSDRSYDAGLTRSSADEVVVHAYELTLPVGVDGEALLLPAPVRCTLRPGALRVRLPRDRPGVPTPRPALDWAELRQLAFHAPHR